MRSNEVGTGGETRLFTSKLCLSYQFRRNFKKSFLLLLSKIRDPSVKQRLTAAAWRRGGSIAIRRRRRRRRRLMDKKANICIHIFASASIHPSIRWNDTHVMLQRFEGEFPNDAENSAPTAKWSCLAENLPRRCRRMVDLPCP